MPIVAVGTCMWHFHSYGVACVATTHSNQTNQSISINLYVSTTCCIFDLLSVCCVKMHNDFLRRLNQTSNHIPHEIQYNTLFIFPFSIHTHTTRFQFIKPRTASTNVQVCFLAHDNKSTQYWTWWCAYKYVKSQQKRCGSNGIEWYSSCSHF